MTEDDYAEYFRAFVQAAQLEPSLLTLRGRASASAEVSRFLADHIEHPTEESSAKLLAIKDRMKQTLTARGWDVG